jgi:hypothetical protein
MTKRDGIERSLVAPIADYDWLMAEWTARFRCPQIIRIWRPYS